MNRKWIYKAFVQKVISFLPAACQFNYVFQKYITKGVRLDDNYFLHRLQHAAKQIEFYKKYSVKSFPESTLELGTGVYMIIPVGYFLCGARNIYTIDIARLVTKSNLKLTLEKFLEFYELKKLENYLPVQNERISTLRLILKEYRILTFDKVLEQLNITYFISDEKDVEIKNNSIDLVHSNNTFEFIPAPELKTLLQKFKQLLKTDGGVMSHFIDLTDHYSHFDFSISNFNFLKYSDKMWKFIDNDLKRQNRLRITDYRSIYKQANIQITEEINTQGDWNALMSLKIDEKFKQISNEDLVIIHSYIISRM